MNPCSRLKIFTLAAAMALLASQATGCSRQAVAGADAVIEPPSRIDPKRVDEAVRAEVNYHRCKAGLGQLAAAGGLAEVAGTHARWMAKAQSLTHKSRVAGQATAMARLKASGVKFRVGSENIGFLARYRIDNQTFRIKNARTCTFATQAGEAIGPHSYATLARAIVTLWLTSSEHRRNILDPKAKKLGSGAGFDARARFCGSFYLSQTFAG